MTRQIHLNLFIQSRGHHEAAWNHPDASAMDLMDFGYYQAIAQRAEAAKFDSIFFADILTMSDDAAITGKVWLEPITLLAAIAGVTERIGLIATASTSYSLPFNLARQFSSIDHISNGRAGWNIVTTWLQAAARNFGDTREVSLDERYVFAEEFVEVVKGLWDSWADDAVIDDRVGAVYARPDRIRAIDHEGPQYSVAGPLNLPRSPQGRPVLVQAGSSNTGRDFAARHAEAIFTAHLEKATAQEFYTDLKARLVKAGRKPDDVLILPGVNPMIASTEAEAKRLVKELNESADPEAGRRTLSSRFGGYDFSHLPLDEVLSPDDFPHPDTVEASRSRAVMVVGLIERERVTLRQLLAKLAGARGHFTYAGTPEQVADLLEDWFQDGAADGFNVMPPIYPGMLDAFIDEVVPILQQRGLFRTEYVGATLREHYGLDRPPDGFDATD
ncbi:MAG: LLM class flavin-dependent oxidoreductase [Alphaproteobacteria bacterium]|nr:LLM class flavin-dependent oxidoreductase [Alphaproteobacteria bacterium]